MSSFLKECTGRVKFFSVSSKALSVAKCLVWHQGMQTAKCTCSLVNEHPFHDSTGKFCPFLIVERHHEVWSCVLFCKDLCGAQAFWVKEDENMMVVPSLKNRSLSWERIVQLCNQEQCWALLSCRLLSNIRSEMELPRKFCYVLYFEQESGPSLKMSSVFFLTVISMF